MSEGSSNSKAGASFVASEGHAFGVRFEGGSLPTLITSSGADLPRTSVERLPADEVEARWAPHASSARMLRQRFNTGGESVVEVQHAPGVGYRMWGYRHGVHLVSEDGTHLTTAPATSPEWLPCLMLVGHAFPLAATLHGRELLHASAVSMNGSVWAFTGPSGAGKSSVATRLLDHGGSFFADDAVSLEVGGDAVVAHPGPRFANVHRHEYEALEPDSQARLGRLLGQSEKLHFTPAGPDASQPLGILVLLHRVPAGADGTITEATDATLELLASAYIQHLDSPLRHLQQLEVAAAISRLVRVVRMPIRELERSEQAAERLVRWAEGSA